MAVRQPLGGQQQSIFRSVFPTGKAKLPRQPGRFEPQAELIAEQVCEILLQDARVATGVGAETFTFGGLRRRKRNGFHSYLNECPPMSDIPSPDEHDQSRLCQNFAEQQSWSLIRRWREQLGSTKIQTMLARVTDRVLTEFVEWSYAATYRDDVHDHLSFWIKNIFTVFIHQILSLLTLENNARLETPSEMATRLFDIGVQRLATLRVQELFDIIVEWDSTAAGVDDLKQYATNPAARSYVTNNFAEALSTRLLHPGASTIEILQVYITIIRAFRRLDPKGVLLERVARRTRRFLRERDDTIKVVVAGLLSDIDNTKSGKATSSPDVLTELAYELQQNISENQHANENELDWNNMDWMPDPVDAAPDYMRSANTDVVGSVISLFESKDIVVRELQTALAERLLRNKQDYDQEISVVEHLKIRFGDNALQACEVMLRDVLDSRKLDQVIRRDQGMELEDANQMEEMEDFDLSALHAKILSRLFWPALPEQNFRPPMQILEQRNRYEEGFESIKQSRKLTWNDAIGQVEIELEFDDGRLFKEEVLPYQATVINAFRSDEDSTGQSIIWSIEALSTELNMSSALVRSAVMFWLSKQVLGEVPGQKDRFTVIEILPATAQDQAGMLSSPSQTGIAAGQQQSAASIQAQAEAAAAQALKDAETAERKQKMALYHQFIVNMLTNQGALPLPRIAMMLGIVVPGGFPFSNEELKEFLNGMVKEGVLEIGKGGAFKISS